MARLVEGVAHVYVMDREDADMCLIPPESFREVFSRDIYLGSGNVFQELIHLGRVSQSQVVVPLMNAVTRLMSSMNTPTADQPAGLHALYIDNPIRGVIPSPLITTIRWGPELPTLPNGLPNPTYEDLDPQKYLDLFQWIGGFEKDEFWFESGVVEGTRLPVYHGIVNVEERLVTEKNPETGLTEQVLYVVPRLAPAGHTFLANLMGIQGSFFQFYPVGGEVYELRASGVTYDYNDLYRMAMANGTIPLENAPYRLRVTSSDFVYQVPIGGGEFISSYYRSTIPYIMGVQQVLPQDPTFLFFLGLSAPVDQVFALYANTSVARIWWGNHYMLEFLPGPSGGTAYFYFFPFGYTWTVNPVPAVTETGAVTTMARYPVDPEALREAMTVSGTLSQRSFRFRYYQPFPNPSFPAEPPYVFVTDVSELSSIWTTMNLSQGETVEGFLVMHIKGHVVICRWSDVVKARSDGTAVKPIFSFNPYEYCKRNFVGAERNFLLTYFSRQTCPPNTHLGMSLYNVMGRVSFADLCYLPMAVATRPFVFAPKRDDIRRKLEDPSLTTRRFALLPSLPSRVYFDSDFVVESHLAMSLKLMGIFNSNIFGVRSEMTSRTFSYLNPRELGERGYYALPFIYPSSDPSIPVKVYLTEDPSSGVTFPFGGTTQNPPYESICAVFWTLPYPEFIVNVESPTPHFDPVPLDFGLSPSLFPTFEDYLRYLNQFKTSLGGTALVTWDIKIKSRRFLPRPPVLFGIEVGRVGIFIRADEKKWVPLSMFANEFGVGSILSSVSVNLTGRVGENTATVTLNIPYQYSQTPFIVDLPPLFKRYLVPYAPIKIELGYFLEDGTISMFPVFEGVIRNVNASISEQGLGLRQLTVTIECNDVGLKLRQATITESTVLDGYHPYQILVQQLVSAGLNPDKHLFSFKGIPLGTMTDFLVAKSSAIGPEAEEFLLYRDYSFTNLVDFPRYVTRRGSNRYELCDLSVALSGMELLSLPTVLNFGSPREFLSRLVLPRVVSSPEVVDAYNIGYAGGRGATVIQTVPTGFYETVPTWTFAVQTIISEGELPPEEVGTILSIPVFLPSQPFVRGIMSFRWDYTQWLLPTYVSVAGRRITGQPFITIFYDLINEIYDTSSPLYRGFRIADISEVPSLFSGVQAVLYVLRRYLQTGYNPPLRASIRTVGLPFITPRKLIQLDTSVWGTDLWVVGNVTFTWRAGQLPETNIDLTVPHPFLIGVPLTSG